MILVFLLIGGSYKPLIYKIFNDYEEVCVGYKMNAITTYEFVYETTSWNLLGKFRNHTDYTPTDECIEYGLRRRNTKDENILKRIFPY